MFERISYTFSLMGASWEVLKKDKELLVFPALSAVCCLLVMASFAIPMLATDSWRPPGEEATAAQEVAYYALLFLFYVCNYFVIVFFNTAVITCAVMRMQGGDPRVQDGLRAAFGRLPLILAWAVVSATVGLILRIIEDRSRNIGAIVASVLGMAWTVVTFVAMPVMVVERKGPLQTLKRSAELLKRTWGEQLIGNFSFGVIFFLLYIPGIILVVLGFASGSPVGAAIGVAVGVVYFVALALIQSVLHSIFRAAVYLYAVDSEAPEEFGDELLAGAMRQR